MIDPSPEETKAIEEGASYAGGEYLESIGKTDLATLTSEEWQTFLGCVIGGYQDCLAYLLKEKLTAAVQDLPVE